MPFLTHPGPLQHTKELNQSRVQAQRCSPPLWRKLHNPHQGRDVFSPLPSKLHKSC